MLKARNFNAIFLALIPALGIYSFNGIPIQWVITILVFIVNIANGTYNKSIQNRRVEIKWFWAVMIIGFVGMLFNSVSSSFYNTTLFFHNLVPTIICFIALIFFTTEVNYNLFKKTLFIVAAFASVICLYQRAMLLLTGSYNHDVFIPGLAVNRDLDTFDLKRVSAFFTEPAHLAIFLAPVFYIALKDNKIIFALLFAGGILFSGSTTGFLLLLLLLIVNQFAKGTKIWKIVLVGLCVLGAYLIIMSLFPDVFAANLEKLASTESNDMRLLGRLQYLEYFNFFQWIFGMGLNQLGELLSSKGIYLTNAWGEDVNADYANAFVYMLLCYGLLGFIFFIKYLFNTIKQNSSNIGFIIIAMGVLLTDQVLFNRNLIYVLSFLLLSNHILIKSETK